MFKLRQRVYQGIVEFKLTVVAVFICSKSRYQSAQPMKFQRVEKPALKRFTDQQRAINVKICQPTPASRDLFCFKVEIAEDVEHARALLKRLPNLITKPRDSARSAFKFLCVAEYFPKRLSASGLLFRIEPRRQDCLDLIVQQVNRVALFRLRVSQTRFLDHQFPAALAHVGKRLLDKFIALSIDGFINSANPFERQARAATVFADAAKVSAALFGNQNQTTTAATNTDNAPRLHNLVEPLMDCLGSRLRLRLMQTRARTDQSFEPNNGRDR